MEVAPGTFDDGGESPFLTGGVRGAFCNEEHPVPVRCLCIGLGLLWKGQ